MVLLGILAVAALSQSQTPSGAEVIKRMESMYAHLQSYSDTGTMTDGDVQISFKTAFEAPGKMYFEFSTDSGAPMYFCASGKKGFPAKHPQFPAGSVKNALTLVADAYVNGEIERDSLEMEIAGFTGISRATAYNVPTMLYPAAAGRKFSDLKKPSILRKEQVGGELCLVVKAGQVTLWIDRKSFALLKVSEPELHSVAVTVYEPVLNPKIPAGQFVSKKPKK